MKNTDKNGEEIKTRYYTLFFLSGGFDDYLSTYKLKKYDIYY
jgi:hypothetical protein